MKAPDEYSKQEIWEALMTITISFGKSEGIYAMYPEDEFSENPTVRNAFLLERLAEKQYYEVHPC